MRTLITGNTYPVRAALHALGGTWDDKKRGWLVPSAKADEARALVAGAPKRDFSRDRSRRTGTGGGYSRYRSHYAYFPSTGGEWYQNKNGRCEDAPCCGCCS